MRNARSFSFYTLGNESQFRILSKMRKQWDLRRGRPYHFHQTHQEMKQEDGSLHPAMQLLTARLDIQIQTLCFASLISNQLKLGAPSACTVVCVHCYSNLNCPVPAALGFEYLFDIKSLEKTFPFHSHSILPGTAASLVEETLFELHIVELRTYTFLCAQGSFVVVFGEPNVHSKQVPFYNLSYLGKKKV